MLIIIHKYVCMFFFKLFENYVLRIHMFIQFDGNVYLKK